ncbi:hypothetical protein F2P81_025519 [Scophthalmus maximus]|uniref:Uncharacterized protein n=1 Tax=Scophthalmus maximus TaxID=52904 RepID=A0A6A4RQ86_SCOMX|nr:hypothetical protein F2P81_025519 [Scophthalmus maximus]
MSLKLGRVLQLWKTSCLVPVPKTPHPMDLNSYRPMALPSHLMKMLERLVLVHLRLLVRTSMHPKSLCTGRVCVTRRLRDIVEEDDDGAVYSRGGLDTVEADQLSHSKASLLHSIRPPGPSSQPHTLCNIRQKKCTFSHLVLKVETPDAAALFIMEKCMLFVMIAYVFVINVHAVTVTYEKKRPQN